MLPLRSARKRVSTFDRGPGHDACVSIFLKEPRPGLVKTRLAASVGPTRAVELYRSFVRDQLDWMAEFRGAAIEAHFSPPDASRALLESLAPRGASGARLAWRPQADGDLGRKLHAAFVFMFQAGFRRAVIVGTDAPLLGPRILGTALDRLATRDLVLGPARDGGYYLIGLRRPEPTLFSGVPWSTGRVLDATLHRARSAGLRHALLEPLDDVDTGADLPLLRAALLDAFRSRSNASFPLRTFRALAAW